MTARLWTLCTLLLSGAFVAPLLAEEDSPQLTARLSANTAHVAEPIHLDLVVSVRAGSKVMFPPVNAKLGDFEVIDRLDRFDIPSSKSVGERIWTRTLTLESLRTGDLEVPALEVQVEGEGTTQLLRSEPLSVRIISVLKTEETPQVFRDIETVVDVSVPVSSSKSWLWWILSAIVGCSILVATVAAVRRRRNQVTPAQWAIGEFERLKQSVASTNTDSAAAFGRLTEILRHYLELQFGFTAPMQSTEELITIVRSEGLLTLPDVECLAAILAVADQAKFAGLQLSRREIVETSDQAKRLIERTNADTLSHGGLDKVEAR